jgi:uncharacterized protein (DUF488 family)
VGSHLFTIGHSNQPLDRFLALLSQHRIRALVDIRRFPGSRKFPHFNQHTLETAVQEAGIAYRWLESLGGRRHKSNTSSSPNAGLQNRGFRNYADYMQTKEFQDGIATLLTIAEREPTAIMCAESLFWRCHRRLVSDFLIACGVAVQHIMPTGDLRPHKLTPGLAIDDGRVTYPDDKTPFT